MSTLPDTVLSSFKTKIDLHKETWRKRRAKAMQAKTDLAATLGALSNSRYGLQLAEAATLHLKGELSQIVRELTDQMWTYRADITAGNREIIFELLKQEIDGYITEVKTELLSHNGLYSPAFGTDFRSVAETSFNNEAEHEVKLTLADLDMQLTEAATYSQELADRKHAKTIAQTDNVIILNFSDQSYQSFMEQLAELKKLLSNDFLSAHGSEGERILAELKAGYGLMSASEVREAALKNLLMPPLKWVADHYSDAEIANLTDQLIKSLQRGSVFHGIEADPQF